VSLAPVDPAHWLSSLVSPPLRPPGRLEPRHASGVCPGCGGGVGGGIGGACREAGLAPRWPTPGGGHLVSVCCPWSRGYPRAAGCVWGAPARLGRVGVGRGPGEAQGGFERWGWVGLDRRSRRHEVDGDVRGDGLVQFGSRVLSSIPPASSVCRVYDLCIGRVRGRVV